MDKYSIERLAAYIDNNLHEEEMREVASMVQADDVLQDIMQDNMVIDKDMAIYCELIDFDQLEEFVPDSFAIPQIEENDDSLNTDSSAYDNGEVNDIPDSEDLEDSDMPISGQDDYEDSGSSIDDSYHIEDNDGI